MLSHEVGLFTALHVPAWIVQRHLDLRKLCTMAIIATSFETNHREHVETVVNLTKDKLDTLVIPYRSDESQFYLKNHDGDVPDLKVPRPVCIQYRHTRQLIVSN
ncbi:hypothetical protein TNCV_552071 [Trichonephila clavipes]|nr:hypothetical protein TNCV_552071 [Trichonephila clavipes]